MTPLVVVAALVVLTGVSGSFLRRRRSARRTSRRQRRALDTLGHISSAPRPAETVAPSPDVTRQAHVRVVAADAAPPLPTPKPLTGGWRPTRATGAAPFRQPTPRGPHAPMGPDHTTAAGGPGGLLDFAVDASPDEAVRVVRSSPTPPLRGEEPGATPAGPAEAVPPQGEATAAPRREATTSATLRFDDLDPPPPPADAPAEPVAGVAGTPAERAAWAEKLATAGGAGAVARQALEAEARSHRTRRHRRRRPTQHQVLVAVGVAAAVVVAVGAAWATGIVGPTRQRPAAVTTPVRHHHHQASRPPVASPPPKTSVAVRLVSNSVGVSVYQLSGPAKITFSAAGPCWVEIKSGGDTGPTVYEAILEDGQTTSVTGPVWVRLGNPTEVTITVAGEKLSPPVTAAVPYDLVFE